MCSACTNSCGQLFSLCSMRLGSAGRRVRTRSVGLVVLASLICGGVLTGFGGSKAATPQATVRSFLSDWARRDWVAMSRMVEHPPADFAELNQDALLNLRGTEASYHPGPVSRGAGTAAVAVTEDLGLADIGTFAHHRTAPSSDLGALAHRHGRRRRSTPPSARAATLP